MANRRLKRRKEQAQKKAAKQEPAMDPASYLDSLINEPEQLIDPEDTQEYERAMGAVSKMLHEDDKTSDALVQELAAMSQMSPESGGGANPKIDAVVKLTAQIIKNLDDRIDLDENIIGPMIPAVVGQLIELNQAANGVQYSTQEMELALGTSVEAVTSMYPEDEAGQQELAGEMGEQEIADTQSAYAAMSQG